MSIQLPSYEPIWPETAVFWGAGATASLGIKTTGMLGSSFFYLAEKGKPLEERVETAVGHNNSEWLLAVKDLLILLGDPEQKLEKDKQRALERQFSKLSSAQQEKRYMELKQSYDWNTLYKVIQICPGHTDKSFQLIDLFNILDLHIQNQRGFYVRSIEPGEEGEFISSEKLILARNALKMLTTLLHTLDFQSALGNKKELIQQYKSFAEVLYHLMIEEGFTFYKAQDGKMMEREFYLFSHSFISLNWDPILLWLLFNVHKEHNQSLNLPHIGNPPTPFKLFHDMANFMGVRQIDGNNPQVWYPFNETVVQRMNDTDHQTSRRVRVGKYYFPHGCLGWRECPNCGKLTMYMGSEWGLEDTSLFPPLPLPSLRFKFQNRSAQEEQASLKGRADAIQCSFCGTLTEAKHTPIVMQTSFKGNNPSFMEEIERDMRISLEGAKHVVLMGYSLPSDDVVYRSILSSKNNRKDHKLFCSAVGLSKIPTNGWLVGDQIKEYEKKLKLEYPDDLFLNTIKSVLEIFGEDRVRICSDGVPNVFLDPVSKNASRSLVKELLYPQSEFPNHEVERKKSAF